MGEQCEHDSNYWEWSWMASEESEESTQYLLDNMQIELQADSTGKTTGGTSYYKKPKHPVVLGEELPLVEDVKVTHNDYYSSKKEFNLQLGGTKVELSKPRIGYLFFRKAPIT